VDLLQEFAALASTIGIHGTPGKPGVLRSKKCALIILCKEKYYIANNGDWQRSLK
jgi:hypothetical protein